MLPTLNLKVSLINLQVTINQILPVLGTLKDTMSTIRNYLPRNDPTNHIQQDLDLLPLVFCSVLDQFSLLENPDLSHILLLYHFLQYFLKTIRSIKHTKNFIL